MIEFLIIHEFYLDWELNLDLPKNRVHILQTSRIYYNIATEPFFNLKHNKPKVVKIYNIIWLLLRL